MVHVRTSASETSLVQLMRLFPKGVQGGRSSVGWYRSRRLSLRIVARSAWLMVIRPSCKRSGGAPLRLGDPQRMSRKVSEGEWIFFTFCFQYLLFAAAATALYSFTRKDRSELLYASL